MMLKPGEAYRTSPIGWVLMLGVVVIFGLSAWLSQKEKTLTETEPTKSQAGSPKTTERPYEKLPIPNHRISQDHSYGEEPFHQDTPLSSWLEILKETRLNPNKRDSYEEAREAIREIGPQAVPF